MLNEKEKKLIRKYYLMPSLGKAFLALSLLIGLVWLILVMVNDLVFHGTFYLLGTLTYLGIVIVYLIAFIVCFLTPRFGMKKEAWKNIVDQANVEMKENDYSSQLVAAIGTKAAGNLMKLSDSSTANKIGDALDVVASIGMFYTIFKMGTELKRQAQVIATVLEVKLPKVKRYVLFIIFLPIILLIMSYVPHFITSKQNMDTSIALTMQTISKLESAYDKQCATVFLEDPNKNYKSSGYQATCHLYPNDAPIDAYSNIKIKNDGVINEVNYVIDVNINASKEENLTNTINHLKRLNQLLKDANVPVESSSLLDLVTLPEGFIAQFQSQSYYERISSVQDGHLSISYSTTPEEEYNQYSSSYFYITLKP